jgi:hypothetical protein
MVLEIAMSARGEIIKNSDLIATRNQSINEMTADEAGAARHQDPHVMAP